MTTIRFGTRPPASFDLLGIQMKAAEKDSGDYPNQQRKGILMTDQMTVEQWLAMRKEAGLHIDPGTAEVEWTYTQTLDPYSVDPDRR
jgi:hypothetical protein